MRSPRFFGRRGWARFPWIGRVFQHRSVRPADAAEVDEEIDYHLERAVQELMAGGLDADGARREALRRFGDVERHRRRLRLVDRRRARKETVRALFEATRVGLRDALRGIKRSPGVALTVIGTLALGIGANATMFGILDRLLLSPPPHVRDADSVVRLYVQRRVLGDREQTLGWFAYPDYLDFQRVEAFSEVAAYGRFQATLGEGGEATLVDGSKVTPSFFRVLGVTPALGRFFTDEEDVVGGAGVVVLGYGLWRRQFGGDPAVIGRIILLGGAEHEVVGVAPQGFNGVELRRVDVWVPLRTPADVPEAGALSGPLPWEESRNWYFLQLLARLRPGASVATAEAQATAAHRAGRAEQVRKNNYDPEARVVAASVIPGRGPAAPLEARVAEWLGGVSGIVLLIACANVANILLARGISRRREIGVRLALGIGGRRLAWELLTESLVLAALGAIAALALAHWGSQAVRALLLPDVDWTQPPLSSRVLAFTGAAALLTGLLAGLAPALYAARQNVFELLAGAARGGTLRRSRLRTAMLVLQTTLSVVLLVAAGLFVRSLAQVRALDLGFEPDGLLIAMPDLQEDLVNDRQRRSAFFSRALDRVRALPAVESAAASVTAPFYSSMAIDLAVPDVPEPPKLDTGGPYVLWVSEEYFRTMGIRILRGRGFTADDTEGRPRVAVVEETMARLYWPGEDPLGKCLKVGGEEAECSTVVGLAEDTARHSLQPEVTAQYYVPVSQGPRAPSVIFVRVGAASPELFDRLRREILAADPGVRYVQVQPLRELIDPQARPWRLGATMFTAFGLLALAIAAVGLYGVLAFAVAQRTHEIGVRGALGATAGEIVALVVRQALLLVGASVLLGLAVAVAFGSRIEPLLFQVSPYDPAVMAGVAAALLLAALAAAAIPARRAAAVDPAVALRVE